MVPNRWFHCPGLENPADRLSRGVSAVSLKRDDLWWSEPRWLKSPRYDWPQQKFRVPDEYMQEKRIVVHTAIVKDDPLIDISRFSSLTSLLRVTAYVLRFLGKLGGRSTQTGPLVAAEISEAEELWVKQVQREHFDFEITRLNQGQQIPAGARVWSLAPYLQEGLLCVKGRLEQSELTQKEKHPILLPRSKYTDLLILHEHNRGFHLGVIAILSRLRERFWIPKGRQSVKSVLKSCLVCRKYSAKPARQQTGKLSKDRVVACPPFTTSPQTGSPHSKCTQQTTCLTGFPARSTSRSCVGAQRMLRNQPSRERPVEPKPNNDPHWPDRKPEAKTLLYSRRLPLVNAMTLEERPVGHSGWAGSRIQNQNGAKPASAIEKFYTPTIRAQPRWIAYNRNATTILELSYQTYLISR
ncbi:hypothetical protein AVEN_14023-1 [Araneus ventricosus]|uniref:Integrase zinc-binding domain-containing protein n=1 Tax=Araneus ventricosus TaxID=182803 RepID=A0A4Y2N0D1_ARAVE|nr:hypothetical protein AVEN_14023-1 [Araneus ventricosus]